MLSKSNLKLGDIVETREGRFYLYAYVKDYDQIYFVRNYGHRISVSHYTDNLLHSFTNVFHRNFDIVNIYKPSEKDRISKINTNIYEFEYPFNIIIERIKNRNKHFIYF